MKLMFGGSYRHVLDENRYVDVSIYPQKWTTQVKMSLWEEGNHVALEVCEKTFLNYEKIFPLRFAKKLVKNSVNKQSQRVANFDLI